MGELNYKQLALQVESNDLGHNHNLYKDLEMSYRILQQRHNIDGEFGDVWQNFLVELNKQIKLHPDSDAAKMLNDFQLAGTDHKGHILVKDNAGHRIPVDLKVQSKYEGAPYSDIPGEKSKSPPPGSDNPRNSAKPAPTHPASETIKPPASNSPWKNQNQ